MKELKYNVYNGHILVFGKTFWKLQEVIYEEYNF